MRDAMDALGRHYRAQDEAPAPAFELVRPRTPWALAPVGGLLGFAFTYALMAMATASLPAESAATPQLARLRALERELARAEDPPAQTPRKTPHGRLDPAREEVRRWPA
jgi:hypothetical protein